MEAETRVPAKTRTLLAGFILLAVVFVTQPAPAAEVKFPEAPPPQNDVTIDNLVPVPMRDGAILYADVYLPAVEGRHPVLVARTPYSTERYPSVYKEALFYARRGYAYVYQDVRGRHQSEGKWQPFRDDIEDGYDTVEWAAQ